MNKAATICFALLGGGVASFAIAQEIPKPDSPSAALVSYEAALEEGDLPAAKALTASFEKVPNEALDQYTTKYSEGARAGKIAIHLVPGSAKTLGDCAVVTFNDGNKNHPDYDPAYLIKQGGKWKVFLKLTEWDRPIFDLSEEQKKNLTELETWFRAEKDKLYGR